MTIDELKEKRKKLKIKQYDMANYLGISGTYLSEIENFKQKPTKSILIAYEYILFLIEEQKNFKNI